MPGTSRARASSSSRDWWPKSTTASTRSRSRSSETIRLATSRPSAHRVPAGRFSFFTSRARSGPATANSPSRTPPTSRTR